jgi:hypothetical protein
MGSAAEEEIIGHAGLPSLARRAGWADRGKLLLSNRLLPIDHRLRQLGAKAIAAIGRRSGECRHNPSPGCGNCGADVGIGDASL